MPYFKNVGSQYVFFTMVTAATGAADTGATVTTKVTIDGGSQASGGGSVTNLGNGQYRYNATSGDMNGSNIGFLFTAASDVPVSISITTEAGQLQLKKNQALAAFPFAMFDSSGNPLSGLSVTVQRSLDGGSFANVNTTGAATGISGGGYYIPLLAGDTNGAAILFMFSAAGAKTIFKTAITQP